jgi:hypothetical protein
MSSQWWDTFEVPVGNGSALRGMLLGKRLTVGGEGRERIETITSVEAVNVGIDRDGIFSAIKVRCLSGETLYLYDDGEVADEDDTEVGWHYFKIKRGEVRS